MSTILDRKNPPAVSSFSRLELPATTESVLDNGVRLVMLDAGDREITRIMVVRDGGVIEADNPGVAVVLPELSMEGTARFSAESIADIIDFNGARCRASAHLHHLSTTLTTLTSKLPAVMPILTDVVSSPLLPDSSLAAIADKAASKIEINMQRVTYQAARGLTIMTKGANHPASRETTPEMMRSITRADVTDFFRRGLNPRSMTLFVSGRLNDAIIESLNRTIGSIEPLGKGIEVDYTPFHPSEVQQTMTTDRPGSLQSAVAMGIPSIGRTDEDYIPLRLAVIALGGYFGSRLMSNIREDKGLTYGIGASLVGGIEGSTIEIMTETDNRYVYPLIEEVKNEIFRLHDPATYTTDEIERMKRYLMTTLASALDTPFTVMDTYANILFSGTPDDYFARQQDFIESMSGATLAEAAAKYIDPDRMYISIAGDCSKM